MHVLTFQTLTAGIVVGSCSLGILACGSSSNPATTVTARTKPGQSTQANTVALVAPSDSTRKKVLARVAGTPLTLADVQHLMVIAATPAPLPDPPRFSGCIARTKQEAIDARKTPLPDARIKVACQKRYEELLQAALSMAIHRMWIKGEAAEEHIDINAQEIQRLFDHAKNSAFKTNAEFEAFRKSEHQTIEGIKDEIKLTQLTEKILREIKERQRPVDSRQVVRYYESHRRQFAIPAGRKIRIIRTATEGAALKAKKELEAGKGFADVAKGLSAIAQPAGTHEGMIADLKPGVIEEKKLNDAIFRAQRNRLYGPLELTATHRTIAAEPSTGFFMFEVIGTVPGGQRPFTAVKHEIAEELAKTQDSRSFTGFVAGFRKKWLARTICESGYIVRNCEQFKQSKAQDAIELHTL